MDKANRTMLNPGAAEPGENSTAPASASPITLTVAVAQQRYRLTVVSCRARTALDSISTGLRSSPGVIAQLAVRGVLLPVVEAGLRPTQVFPTLDTVMELSLLDLVVSAVVDADNDIVEVAPAELRCSPDLAQALLAACPPLPAPRRADGA